MNYLIRYVMNGLVATGIHYSVLTFLLKVLQFSSAGLSNLLAAVVGITVSFLGSRYFVFRRTDESLITQGAKFSLLYGLIAFLHGAVLYILTDRLLIDYRISFLCATVLQVLLSFFGNKILVFKV